jgi:aminoglycoside phosphotransferase (APT) family kinase protein
VDPSPPGVEHHHVHRLRHGYTNHTSGDMAVVIKTYHGPDAFVRLARECEVLKYLRGRMPVPEIHATLPGQLAMEFVPGAHGQDLIEQGHAGPVLRACGGLLRALHAIPLADLEPSASAGQVLVHGDFGPNNVLLDPTTFTVTALLDWEFAHLGESVEDLAWCEWIIRAHHPHDRGDLGEFFAGYAGPIPAWPRRQATMVARCRQLEQFCQRWEPDGQGAALWAERAAVAATWSQ